MIRNLLAAVLGLVWILGAQAAELALYGTQKTFNFRILAADGTYVTNATDGGTDVTLTCDDGTPGTATNDFADEGSHYSWVATATELECARLVVDVADAIANGFIVETYGDASAAHPVFPANVAQWLGTAPATPTTAGVPEVDVTHWNAVALATTNPLPNAAADGAGGLPISAAGGLDLDAQFAKLGTMPNLGGGANLGQALRDLAGATFDTSTDSAEALRNRGDAAWITATGFSTFDATTDGVFLSTSVNNCRPALGCSAQGTLTGTHSSTTADLGTNAPGATSDVVGKVLTIPAKFFSRVIVSYNTGTGVATFAPDTALTLEDDDQWYLYETPPSPNPEADLYDTLLLACEVNTANFAGSSSTLACILTDRNGGAVTQATGDLEGLQIVIASGDQVREQRFINDTTWDAGNSELQLTLSRALPDTLADGVTAIIR